MKTSGLATPAFVLDVDTLKANMAAMNKILEKSSLKLRPHYKSHKCASLAKWQKESEDNFYFYMLRRNGRHTPRIQLFPAWKAVPTLCLPTHLLYPRKNGLCLYIEYKQL